MNRDSTFHVLVFLMAVLIFSMPFTTLAQQQQNPVEAEVSVNTILKMPGTEEAKAQAIADAEKDTDKTSWFMAGCFLNILGIVAAQIRTPPVPADRLVGKSPEYVAVYTLSYQAKRTQLQAQSALWGCLTGVGICVGVLVMASTNSGGGGGGSWCSPFL
ncbi:MAG: hypothetical protein OYL97_10825 [Candidatus Poribacteria bacterium]|nr:hypothetical protein [Candidatus Poribacteria bacterium]MDE0467541.1 hypothetical protein [Candidatus Poribacteria bacterium]